MNRRSKQEFQKINMFLTAGYTEWLKEFAGITFGVGEIITVFSNISSMILC